MNRRTFGIAGAAVAVALAASSAVAASRDGAEAFGSHVRGTIVAVTTTHVDVRTASGIVRLSYEAATVVQQLVPVAADAIAPNAYVGIATVGANPAVARYVTVFPEAARGKGEGRHPWDLPRATATTNGVVAPVRSTMTNGRVAVEAVRRGARTVELVYAGGRSRIVVPAGTPIVTYVSAARALVVPGAHVFVFARGPAAHPQTAQRILVGKDGYVPPL